jgi:hypothetical protein
VSRSAPTVPYENATSGAAARDEITKLLRHLGCEKVGFMDDYESGEILLAFSHRGRSIQLRASAKGWAQMYLRAKPYREQYSRKSRHEYEQAALKQGLVAVNSVLRDWVKGQITAIECGILSFEAVFVPYMLTNDGRPLIEYLLAQHLLPHPAQEPS